MYCDAELRWDANGNPDAVGYEVLITDLEGNRVRRLRTAQTAIGLEGDDRLPDGTYRWRVNAVNCAGGNPVPSPQGQFVVDNRPPPPVLRSPAADEWSPGTPTFEWTHAGARADVTFTVGVDGQIVAADLPIGDPEAQVTTFRLPAERALGHGEHAWQVRATGCMGSAALSGAPRTFRVDRRPPPEFDLVGPDDGWRSLGPVTFQWEPSVEAPDEGVGTEACRVFVDGAERADVPAPGIEWTLARLDGLDDGAHAWWVVCRDAFGNERESSRRGTLRVDATPPVAAAPLRPPPNAVLAEARPTFEWEPADDATSGVAGYRVLLNGEVVSGDDLLPPEATTWTPGADLPEGVFGWTVEAVDRAGNRRQSDPRTLVLDRTAPRAAEIVSPRGVSSDLRLCWRDSLDRDVCAYEVRVDGEVEYAAITPDDARRDDDGCVNFFNIPADGPHTWSVTAVDCAGNRSETSRTDFVLETLPPERFVAIDPPHGVTVRTLTPFFCWQPAVDRGTGVDHYALFIDDMNEAVAVVPPAAEDGQVCARAPAALENGNHLWRVDAVDGAGNRRRADGMPWGFTVDEDIFPPTCGITAPAEGALAGCVEYRFAGTADDVGPDGRRGSGIARVEYQLDGTDGEWTAAELGGTEQHRTWSAVWDGETGRHTLYCRAVDREGNVQAEPAARAFTVDCEGPRVFDLVAPDNEGYVGACPTFRWAATTDELTDMGRYEVRITPAGGGEPRVFDAGAATSLMLAGDDCLDEGTYTWTVRAYDALGNGRDARGARTLRVDLTGPVAFPLTAQEGVNAAGWTARDRVVVRWSATDDLGAGMAARPYQVILDGEPVGPRIAETTFTLTGLDDGAHTWTVRAFDALGNATDATVEAPLGAFRVDTRGPGRAEAVSLRLYANDVPTFPARHDAHPRDTGLVVEAGERLRVAAAGQLCFTDDASCDPRLVGGFCMGPEGNDHPPGRFTKFYPHLRYGRVVAVVAGREGDPVDVGPGAEIFAPADGRLQLAVNDNDAFNCRSRWHEVSVQRLAGFNLSLPPDGVVTKVVRPTLSWSEVDDGEGIGVARLEVLLNGEVVDGNLPPDATSFELPEAAALVEGDHRWQIRAYDGLGNVGTSDVWTIRVDLTPPEPFGLTAPAEGAVVRTATPDLCWERTRDTRSVMAHYLVYIDEEYATAQYPDAEPCVSPPAPLDDGRHCFHVVAQDELRHERTSREARCFVVDTQPPAAFELLSPAPGAESFTARPEFCWAPTTDAGTGVVRYELSLSGNHVATVEPPEGEAPEPGCRDVENGTVCFRPADPAGEVPARLCWQPAAPLPNGRYEWFVRAYDGADAATTAGPRPVTIDRDVTPPEVAFVEPVAGELFGRDGVAVACAAEDGPRGTGVVGVEVFSPDDVDRFAAAERDPVTGQWRTLWPVEADGQLRLCCRAEDAEGNLNPAEGDHAYPCVTVRTDVSPPEPFALRSPGGDAWVTARPTFEWAATRDDPAGLARYILAIEGRPEIDAGIRTSYELSPEQALPEGRHTWTVRAVDALGNERPADGPLTFRVDGQRPGAPAPEAPAEGAWRTTARVELCWQAAADEGGSGICRYDVTLDGRVHAAGDATCFTPPVDLADADHTWTVAAVDCAGNVGPASPIRTFRVDRTAPPPPAPTFPDDGARSRVNPPVFRWLAAEDAPGNPSGICGYRVSVGDEVEEAPGDATSLAWPRRLPDGEYRWAVRSVDCAGNVGPAGEVRILRIDTVPPPDTVILEPAAGAVLADGRTTVRWRLAGDPEGVCAYVVAIDGEEQRLDPDRTERALELDEGRHSVTVAAEDCAENRSAAPGRVEFTVDLTPPDAPRPLAPADGACLADERPTLQWAAGADALSEVVAHEVELGGARTLLPGDAESFVPAAPVGPGLHTWRVRARDAAGHEATSEPSTFHVDRAAPACAVEAAAEDAESPGVVVVRGVAADDGCGLARVEVRVNDAEWALVDEPPGPDGEWRFSFEPTAGEHVIGCRATDPAGNVSDVHEVSLRFDACNRPAACDPATGRCDVPVADDAPCDDGDPCTLGDTCRAGACVAGAPLVCDDPPAAECADDATARTYAEVGRCVEGECVYDAEEVACDGGGEACFADRGACVDGACVPEPLAAGAACDDGDPCTVDDVCDGEGACRPGAPVACDAPPPPRCEAGSVSVTYAAPGVCGPGGCAYAAHRTACPRGCDAATGLCAGDADPCENVVCDRPPGPCFAPVGRCVAGVCQYEPLEAGAACDDGDPCTEGDACDGEGRCAPAGRVICDEPPAPACLDADTWVTYAPRGACLAGECAYAAQEVPCPGGCDEACAEPSCEGVTCDAPPGACFATPGTCADGVCDYTPRTAGDPCDDGDPCTIDDACDGEGGCAPGAPRRCDAPPPPTCLDAETARVFAAEGRCVGGECTYEPLDVPCAHGCDPETGRCAPGPCPADPCDTPPGACFTPEGVCQADGTCRYDALPAGESCDDGDPCTVEDACDADGACAGRPRPCDTPPPPTCADARTRRTFPGGRCEAGECVYDPVDEPCLHGCDPASGACRPTAPDAAVGPDGGQPDATAGPDAAPLADAAPQGLTGNDAGPSSDAAGPDPSSDDGGGGGCACDTPGGGTAPPWLALLLALIARRRRAAPSRHP